MNLGILAWRSLLNRRSTAILTIISVAVSVMLLLGVEKVRVNARLSFANTISGTDLIVGSRSGSIQLLLYSIFRMGNATNNISWKSYQSIAQQPGIKWSIPISLGDSHHGFRVIGTTTDYFSHYQYGNKRVLEFSSGVAFNDIFDVVLGAEVAKSLNYKIGRPIIVSHGLSNTSLNQHDDKPFRVVGILKPTGTPVDRSLHVSLSGIEAMHLDWQNGVKIPGASTSIKRARKGQLQPKSITAFLLGLDNKILAFKLQRMINQFEGESLQAIFPGVALHELWSLMSIAEKALLIISLFVVVAALIGMLAVSLAGLNERRREVAILRSVGASHWHITFLLVAESLLLTLLGIALGLFGLYTGIFGVQSIVESKFGLFIPITLPDAQELTMLSILVLAGFIVGLVPAYRAYRNSLIDGLSAKI
jgi:putative ABC transport system permease protein